MELIESAIPYTGNKFKALPTILENLPSHVGTFVDVFCGSGVVGSNVNADKIIMNDLCNPLITLLWAMATPSLSFAKEVELGNCYENSEEGYYQLRDMYNKTKDSALLYNLICRSFNNQIRFNNKREFNLPYGKRNRLDINKLEKHCERLSSGAYYFCNWHWEDVLREYQDREGVTFFLDPPYLCSTATYNSSWTEQDEIDLYKTLDNLTKKGVKWLLTNAVNNRGRYNEHFDKFQEYYNSVPLNGDFRNSSRFKSNHPTIELLVRNY